MTTAPMPANAGAMPDYDDDAVLRDLTILQHQLSAAAVMYCGDARAKHEGLRQVFALIETARTYVEHMHRSLTAAAYPNSEAQP